MSSTGLLVPPKKSSKPEGEKKAKQANVKLAEDLVHKLGVISQWRKKSISAICDPELRPFVEREFEMVVAEMDEAIKSPKTGQK